MPEEINKPADLRDIDFRQAMTINPTKAAELVKHRRLITDATPEEMAIAFKAIDVSGLDQTQTAHLNQFFPNYQRALWLYEKAPEPGQVKVLSAQKLSKNRNHTLVTFTSEDEQKQVVFKETGSGRMEKMMAEAQKMVGLPSFRVLCADGRKNDNITVEGVPTGKQINDDEFYSSDVEQIVVIASTQYVVMEAFGDSDASDYVETLSTMSEENQRQFIKNIGKIRAFELLFGVVDDKLEHIKIKKQTLEMSRIDLEQSLKYFNTDIDESYFDEIYGISIFDSSLTQNVQRDSYLEGVRELLASARTNLPQLRELVRRKTNFGVGGANTKVGLFLTQKIETQLELLETAAKIK